MPNRDERRVCPRCSTGFVVTLGTAGRPAEYCSTACRRAVARQNAVAKAEGRNPAEALELAKPRQGRSCDWCGNEFTPPARGRAARYCKKSCANLASRSRVRDGSNGLDRDAQATLEARSRTLGVSATILMAEALDAYWESEVWAERKREHLARAAELL